MAMRITVAIPTIAGRARYLQSCLETCVGQTYPDLEILVSDNSPGAARELVSAFSDPRIRYVQPDRYLPMAQHWDFMLPHMTGDLVTVIGDDDGLMPNSLETVANLIGEWGLRPLQHTIAHYCWPDVADERRRNTYWFHQLPGNKTEIVSTSDYVSRLCRCEARYIDGPMVYHNFVPRRVLQVLARDGQVFHRSSPDVYTAVSVALCVPDFISTQLVLTVAGEGAKSNGAQVRDGGEEARRFMNDIVSLRELPHCQLHTFILAVLDSIYEAALRYDRPEVRKMVDRAEFYAVAINECRAIRSWALRRQRLLAVAADILEQRIAGRVAWRTVKRAIALAGRTAVGRRPAEPWNTPRLADPQISDVSSAALFVSTAAAAGQS